jgi:hypothetical protein
MEVKESRKKDYRTIYEELWKLPKITKEVINKKTKSGRFDEAMNQEFIKGPEIHKRSFRNLGEYVYFVNFEDPYKEFLRLYRNHGIVYYAKTLGFCNMVIFAKEEIDFKAETILEGYRSDYYVSYAPDCTWDQALETMEEKINTFNPDTYNPQETIQTHFDDMIDWDSEDELLFNHFRSNLRRPFTSLIEERKTTWPKAHNFLNNLPNTCTIHTSYYPHGFSAYTLHFLMFDTNYEDFIIDLFSELPTTAAFFKVSNRLFIQISILKSSSGTGQQQEHPWKTYFPYLIVALIERGTAKSSKRALVECFGDKETVEETLQFFHR